MYKYLLFLIFSAHHVKAISIEGDSTRKNKSHMNAAAKLEAIGFPNEFEGFDIFSTFGFPLFLVMGGIALLIINFSPSSSRDSPLAAFYGLTLSILNICSLILSGQNFSNKKRLKGRAFLYANFLYGTAFIFVTFFLLFALLGLI